MDDATLRRVDGELNALTSLGGELHRHSPLATNRPGQLVSPERIRFQRRLLDEFIAEGEADVQKDGLAAVVTAGPPGAGKSTIVRNLHLGGPGWRIIDADEIKLKLLDAAVRDGIFDKVLVRRLADGYFIMPNELSSLVHNESVQLADRLIERSLEARENVVIEGTLSWPGLPRQYTRMLELHEYTNVTIVDVEVDCATALEQAYFRWSEGRTKAINGDRNGGGRFTPREAITAIYDASGFSVCNQNAIDLFNSPGVAGFSEVGLIVSTGPLPEDRRVYRRIVGDHVGEAPGYLKDTKRTTKVD